MGKKPCSYFYSCCISSLIFFVSNSEIRKAPGILEAVDDCAEVILFSTDIEILSHVEEHDRALG